MKLFFLILCLLPNLIKSSSPQSNLCWKGECSHFCTESRNGLESWCSCYKDGACTDQPFDAFFILDASESVTTKQFETQIQFVNTFGSMYLIRNDSVQIGAIAFNSDVAKIINLRQSKSAEELLRITKRAKFSGNGTDLANAVTHAARFRLKRPQGRRSNVPLVVIIITDGVSTSDKQSNKKAIRKLRKRTPYVYTIGVGPDVDNKQLVQFALDYSNRTVNIPSFKHLNHDIFKHFNPCFESNSRLQLSSDKRICDLDECLAGIDGCSHSCINTIGSYQCECPDGFYIGLDNRNCVTDRCSLNPCDQICEYHDNGNYTCSCYQGFSLHDDLHSCTDIDECLLDNGGCQEDCVNSEGAYHCMCENGFLRDSDDKKCVISCYTCTNAKSNEECTALEVCRDNQASCFTTLRTNNNVTLISKGCQQSLACINNFKQNTNEDQKDLKQCNQAGDNSKCECCCFYSECNNQTCSYTDDLPRCEMFHTENISYVGAELYNSVVAGGFAILNCPTGYVPSGDIGFFTHITCEYDSNLNTSSWSKDPSKIDSCIDFDDCKYGNGGCVEPAICQNIPGGFICTCPEMNTTDVYEIIDGRFCDKNECANEDNGSCSHECVNRIGYYECVCPEDLILSNDGKNCRESKCNLNNGGCAEVCEEVQQIIRCSCFNDTFELSSSDGFSCVKKVLVIDVCRENNGNCSHQCAGDDQDNVICSCPDHMFLHSNNKSCILKVKPTRSSEYWLHNECLKDNGGCSDTCTDLEEGFFCSCPKGKKLGEYPNNTTCIDIDECQSSPCVGGYCVNSFGDFFCVCSEMNKLDTDRITCVERPSEADCEKDYLAVGHSCMKQIPELLTYNEADGKCSEEGSRLVVVNDMGVLRGIIDTFQNTNWIGLRLEGVWINSDSTNHTINYWVNEEPNENGACGSINGRINNMNCSLQNQAICEKERETSLTVFTNSWPTGATAKLYMPTDKDSVTLTFPHAVEVNAWHCAVNSIDDFKHVFSQTEQEKGGGKGKCEFIIKFENRFPAEDILIDENN